MALVMVFVLDRDSSSTPGPTSVIGAVREGKNSSMVTLAIYITHETMISEVVVEVIGMKTCTGVEKIVKQFVASSERKPLWTFILL